MTCANNSSKCTAKYLHIPLRTCLLLSQGYLLNLILSVQIIFFKVYLHHQEKGNPALFICLYLDEQYP